tara:strand:+ start:450 stop:908 length:459 start_codon:yes stop_codon:yes gene_type:complete
MNITKRQLKKIIKEELEATLSENDPASGENPQTIADVADALGQSEVVMSAVQQLSQDPELATILAAAMEEGNLGETYDRSAQDLNTAKTAVLGGGTIAIASLIASSPTSVFATTFLPWLAASPAAVSLGIVGGPLLMALGVLIAKNALNNTK